ncbi:MAG: DUF6788 family protein [Acidimicrobiales bacterium]
MTSSTVALTDDHSRRAEAIADELAAIAATGKVLPGSIIARHTHCGRPGCRCMADPPRPHGPYWQWTRKLAGRTAGRWLNAEQADDYQSWIANHRRLRQLLAELEALGVAALDTDTRTPSRRAPVDKPGTTTP